MQYVDSRTHLHVQIDGMDFEIPGDELVRIEQELDAVGECVREFPSSEIRLLAFRQPDDGNYRFRAELKVPGRRLAATATDVHLDTAVQKCLRNLARKAEAYRDHPDVEAIAQAQRRKDLDEAILAPFDADVGPLADAVRDGDYRAFRLAVARYEEWIRKRAGRWIQRYPEAQAQVGDTLLTGDVVEEVFLNAFESFADRPKDLPFGDWTA